MQPDSDDDFHAWVLHHRERLYKRAYLICGSWHQADDLVQDTLIKVYPRWRRITERGDPMAYVRQTLVRACIDQSRRPWRRERVVLEVPDRPIAEDADGNEQLEEALAEMPARQRAVLVLRYWDQLSVAETAAALGTSTGNVKSLSSRGMSSLRAALSSVPELER